jgi:uncharacterized protein YjiS (DUF1127 family)
MSTIQRGAEFQLVQRPRLASTGGLMRMVRVQSAWRALRNRLAANRVCDLDDRMLDDIGLTRRDVDAALHHSGALDDPSLLLASAARERARTRFARPPKR